MLAAIINQETYNGLPEDVKKEYKAGTKDPNGRFDLSGRFLLDVGAVDGFALEDVSGLKSAYSKEHESRKDLEKKVKDFEGIDPAKAREALEKLDKLKDLPSDEKVKEQIEAIKKQLSEKHTGELKIKEDSIGSLTKQLEKVMIEASAIKAIAENKGSAELLLPHIKNSTRIKKNDAGEYSVEVVDKDGNVRISPATGSTAPMSITELVGEMKGSDTFAPAFEGSNRRGGGTPPGGDKGGADLSNMTPAQKMRYARENRQT